MTNKVLINKWIARIVATLFVALISAEVFTSGMTECWTGVFILLIGLGVGWKWPKIGAVIFFVLAGLLAALTFIPFLILMAVYTCPFILAVFMPFFVAKGISIIILTSIGVLFWMTKPSKN